MSKRRMKVQFFKGKDGLWYWNVTQSNGRIVAVQGDGLVNKADSIESFTNYTNKLKEGLYDIKQ